MSEVEPNDEQEYLIENTEGIYLVDAGPGTGKTFTVTWRYANIIDQPDVEPDDVLLATFTRSAAAEMKERIVEHSGYGTRELGDAPIQTFHSYCHDLLQEYGYAAPTYLGIDDHITGATQIIEDEIIEGEFFREFIGNFRDEHPEYADVFRSISNPIELLDVVNNLASKGVFPTRDGWYRDSEEKLEGDYDEFKDLFDEANEPKEGKRGKNQSQLRDDLSDYGDKTYLSDAPEKSEIRGGRGTKRIDDEIARRVFDENREHLKEFVHDIYFEYIEFALSRNYLNFGFLQLLAFVLLCEEERIRESVSFEYIMVDEFQDTSEIQFKLALLLAGTNNFCAVGDWKQSIYSFQYADVDNIRNFEERLERFSRELNDDTERVGVSGEVNRKELKKNYRSSDDILRFSEDALVTPAKGEDIDDSILDEAVKLEADTEFNETKIEAVAHEDEHEAVLTKIHEIVGNEEYAVIDQDDGGDEILREPEYGDIAVLTRTRDFGRELLHVADRHSFPMSYDGGIELFRTDPAKLLLSWLRILEYDSEEGWAVVLERAGYSLDEIDQILDTRNYPSKMSEFRDEVSELKSIGAVARRVFDKYGMEGGYADALLHVIESLHGSTTMTWGDLIRFIERGIENGSTYEVNTTAGDNSVTVQTIHSVKGLEYPIVILANMNENKFPPTSGSFSTVQYHESVGIRKKKTYDDSGEYPHIYDKWEYDVYRHCLPNNYDEERRLLYVAVTRAESHLCFVGGENPNTFLKELSVDIEDIHPEIPEIESGETIQEQLPFSVSPPEGPEGYSPHSLMKDVFDNYAETESDETVEVDQQAGGLDFGSDVHEFAEKYALGEDVTPSNDDERHIKELIDGLEGELRVEEKVTLPLTVDGEDVVIRGVVDLVNILPDRVEIIDYKTDRRRLAHDEYRKQISVYYHVLDDYFPDSEVTADLFYTNEGERVNVDVVSMNTLENLVRETKEA